ncbi:putative porin [Flavobacterium agricola]|uniref:Porin n=1 Tax=Flavobacterium agricola TaxID=2870839 RepID=A0ABY6LX63_9FLAO|nr:putative porin [Flavobacterium agricola]UYW00557.1 putative porin [Flavobacterium agricola]
MKQLLFALLVLFSSVSIAQFNNGSQYGNASQQGGLNVFSATENDTVQHKSFKFDKTTIDEYKIISIHKDTTYVDTTLTIQAEYKHNYLRKDNFGLLQFDNEGHVYNTLDFNLNKTNSLPDFGFKARSMAYLTVDDIKYYHVPTPFTDLYYKSVMGRGQNLDAFVTANLKPNLNFGIGYRGLRSTGYYFNELTSTGSFRFLTSYNTPDKRYYLKAHFAAQDFMLRENGGLSNLSQYENPEGPYTNKAQVDVYMETGNSMLKGQRIFIDHSFRINKTNPNSLVLHHQFIYDNKFYNYINASATSRFGDYFTSNLNDKTRFNRMYNQVGVAYKHDRYGSLKAYIEDINYNYFYKSYVYSLNGLIPNKQTDRINTLGANYFYQINKWKLYADAKVGFVGPATNQLDLTARYAFDDANENVVELGFQRLSKIPDLNYTLFQSSYLNYNWYNNFINEKSTSFLAKANTKWINAEVNYRVLNNHLYFANTSNEINLDGLPATLLAKPFQYSGAINYFSAKVGRQFKFGKFGSDHTVLYQKVSQNDPIVNVPEILTRNSIFYNNHFFNKALYMQTGFTINYFTKYYANEYNTILGDMTVQHDKEIGDYPVLDFFVNAKIRTFRLFLKAENINSKFVTKQDFYASPNYPAKPFMIRFGITWMFFS